MWFLTVVADMSMTLLPALGTFSFLFGCLVWLLSCLIVSCFVLFGCCLLEACSFLKRKERGSGSRGRKVFCFVVVVVVVVVIGVCV